VAGLSLFIQSAIAQPVLKVAAICTTPAEQQWVSCVHKALNAAKDRGEIDYDFSENVSNADYERLLRQYADFDGFHDGS